MTAAPMRHHDRCVVVSGLPASGKSTVARALASALCFDLLDKDDFLEARFKSCSVGDAAQRRRLSADADIEFQQRAETSRSVVLTSWWKHPLSAADSGTRTDWLIAMKGSLVEVHCHCSASIAASRFLARARHPGHLDGSWTRAELLASFARQAPFGPLGICPVVLVNTEVEWNIGLLLAHVHGALAACADNRA